MSNEIKPTRSANNKITIMLNDEDYAKAQKVKELTKRDYTKQYRLWVDQELTKTHETA